MEKFFELVVGIVTEIHTFHMAFKSDTLSPDRRPILTGDVCDVLERYLGDGYSIDAYVYNNSTSIHGMYIRRDKRIQILHPAQLLNRCNQRFVIAKELCHVLTLKKPEYFTSNPGDLVEILMKNQGMFVPANTDLAKQQNADVLAKMVGLLILFPFNEMLEMKAARDGGSKTDMDIAEQYKIPARLVYWALDDSIIEWLKKVHKQAGVYED